MPIEVVEHEWDTDVWFCTRCGASKKDVVDGVRVECNDGVVAISHIIARRKITAFIDGWMAHMIEDWKATR